MNNFRYAAVCLVCFLQTVSVFYAQNGITEIIDGAVEMEEMDETEAERLSDLAAHPVRINTATLGRLAGCGLFTRYQAASLADYRSVSGDILSLTELASVDGFDKEFVSAIAKYIDLSSKAPPGSPSTDRRNSGSITARGTLKTDGGGSTSAGYALKAGYSVGSRFSLNAGIRDGGWSASAAYYGRGHLDKVIIGDYNARFGQGLTMWSGFSLSGLSSCGAFSRKATGISASKSYSGAYALRGAAVEMNWNRTSLSCFGTIEGLAGASIHTIGRNSGIGMTACFSKGYSRIGADASASIRKFDFWTEAAYDFTSSKAAGSAGMRWNQSYGRSVSLLVRYYPTGLPGTFSGAARASSKAADEFGLAVGISTAGLSSTLDAARFISKGYFQIRNITVWTAKVGEEVSLRLRSSVRIRPGEELPLRIDLRCDSGFDTGAWKINGRLNWLRCSANAFLAYAEAGHSSNSMNLWLRVTGFIADRWEDRISCYERDGPGNFNVPAYYGRGVSASGFAGWKFGRSSLYARISATGYFSSKPWKLEGRIQYSVRL